MYGLSEKTYSKIKQVLEKYDKVDFKLFGSRARGTYRENSDIDIAIVSEISEEKLMRIVRELNELNIIYKIDVVYVPKCDNIKLVENIQKEGVEF